MSITMQREDRDVWPGDVPVGTFDIIQHGLQGKDEVTAHIMFVCPGAKRCGVFLGPACVDCKTPDDLCVWQWDGDVEKPTIKPSINCVGGCGAHFFITTGIMV
jgi:Family of unknown function (DUF6527)